MLLEFSSTRPPDPPAADRPWQRSYWPGGVTVAIGLALLLPGGWGVNVLGQFVAMLGGCLLGSAVLARRSLATDANREPRQWTINNDGLRSGNRLGSTCWTWIQVRRVVERPDVYLLYQSDSTHTATFDIPETP